MMITASAERGGDGWNRNPLDVFHADAVSPDMIQRCDVFVAEQPFFAVKCLHQESGPPVPLSQFLGVKPGGLAAEAGGNFLYDRRFTDARRSG